MFITPLPTPILERADPERRVWVTHEVEVTFKTETAHGAQYEVEGTHNAEQVRCYLDFLMSLGLTIT